MSTVTNDAPGQTVITSAPAPTPTTFLSTFETRDHLRRLLVATLSVLLVALVIHLLDLCASILKPLLIACFLLYVLMPVHQWLVDRGLPSSLAYTFMLIAQLGLFIGIGALVYGGLNELQGTRLDFYEQQVDRRVRELLTAIGLSESVVDNFRVRQLFFSASGLNEQMRKFVLAVSGTFVNFLAGVLVVLVYVIFLLLEKSLLPARVARAFGDGRAEEILQIAHAINRAISRYIGVLALVSILQGVLSTTVLGLLGVDYFVVWGVVIALFNLVPYIGGLVSIPLPIIVCFIQFPDEPWRGAVALILLLGIQWVVDNWVTPRLTGERLGVSPILVLFALAFWGWLWGVVGLLLGVPLTVMVKIILQHLPETKPIAVMMSDK